MFQATVSSLPQPAGLILIMISRKQKAVLFIIYNSEEAAVLDSNNDAIGYLLAKRRGYDSLRLVINNYENLKNLPGYF